MRYENELQKATVVGKYNGIIIDAQIEDGTVVSVFCAAYDVAKMCVAGVEIYIRSDNSDNKKITYELEFVVSENGLIYGRPNNNNTLFEEAFNIGLLTEFVDYTECRRLEPDDHLPHIDFELSNSDGKKCFVFVTNVYNKFGSQAIFPMEVNFFELEMFEEMQKLRAKGYNTCAFIIVPRMDCQELKFSWKYSPLAAAKIFEEAKNGLNFIGYGCNVDKKSVSLSHSMPILY